MSHQCLSLVSPQSNQSQLKNRPKVCLSECQNSLPICFLIATTLTPKLESNLVKKVAKAKGSKSKTKLKCSAKSRRLDFSWMPYRSMCETRRSRRHSGDKRSNNWNKCNSQQSSTRMIRPTWMNKVPSTTCVTGSTLRRRTYTKMKLIGYLSQLTLLSKKINRHLVQTWLVKRFVQGTRALS